MDQVINPGDQNPTNRERHGKLQDVQLYHEGSLPDDGFTLLEEGALTVFSLFAHTIKGNHLRSDRYGLFTPFVFLPVAQNPRLTLTQIIREKQETPVPDKKLMVSL
ncbi:hypothetical protein [Sporolactobacillus pectinivorans]|uniref:hypothetical protein n=1 Tax=Sporolactobacillus pectinivorans TaxID=1591408 RepID=UPI000C256E8D|nr:hypothetical protein [Sporolactobacillus pectinivorans]